MGIISPKPTPKWFHYWCLWAKPSSCLGCESTPLSTSSFSQSNQKVLFTSCKCCLQLYFDHLKNSLGVFLFRRHLSNWSNVMTTLNSAVNFVVYCAVSRKFRTDVVNMLCCRTGSTSPLFNGEMVVGPLGPHPSRGGSSTWLARTSTSTKYTWSLCSVESNQSRQKSRSYL